MAWVELDGQNVFTIDNASHVIRVGVRTAEVTSEPTVLKSLRCLRLSVDRKSNAASVFVALAFVSNVWYVRVFIRLTTIMLYERLVRRRHFCFCYLDFLFFCVVFLVFCVHKN